ncbi:hypothetical protein HBB16_03515 [Pseudonocardia sp. MCCB 268]|nr:hypothetical protein [Pseudonocardia cytotoxica]
MIRTGLMGGVPAGHAAPASVIRGTSRGGHMLLREAIGAAGCGRRGPSGRRTLCDISRAARVSLGYLWRSSAAASEPFQRAARRDLRGTGITVPDPLTSVAVEMAGGAAPRRRAGP